jgi:hypothetical protein
MDNFSSLFKKEHTGELVLVILFIIYLIMGYKTPQPLSNLIDSVGGKIVIFIVVIYLFLNTNSILAVLALFVAFELIRRSSSEIGMAEIQTYMPSEQKKTSQFTAFNQFPFTLEQEVVNKMAPIMKTGTSINPPSYKPLLDNLYDASPLNVIN